MLHINFKSELLDTNSGRRQHGYKDVLERICPKVLTISTVSMCSMASVGQQVDVKGKTISAIISCLIFNHF